MGLPALLLENKAKVMYKLTHAMLRVLEIIGKSSLRFKREKHEFSAKKVHMKHFLRAVYLIVFLAAFSSAAFCAPPTFLGKKGHWQAFSTGTGKSKSCFMVSEPIRQEGDFTKRGKPHVLITHTPANKTFDTVSIVAGYTYKPQSEVEVQIDATTFTLFTHEDTAWAPDGKTDGALVKRMKEGSDMHVEGTSSRGTLIKDTYSLSGFSAGHTLIHKSCGRQP